MNIFTVHSKKILIKSWKTEEEHWTNKNSKRLIKTKAEFFKDLLPGDIVELSFSLYSTTEFKVTAKAWRGDKYIGLYEYTLNKIANAMYCFNLIEID